MESHVAKRKPVTASPASAGAHPLAPLPAAAPIPGTPPLPPTLQYVPLSTLRFGIDCPGGSINPRRHGADDADDLLPTLREFGVIIPMVVKTVDGLHYCNEGNRRLVGLHKIHAPEARGSVMVPTVELVAGIRPLDAALIVNTLRADLHPVDRFEVLHVLVQDGATVEDIARRYVMKPGQVRQALAIAALSPKVRAAWRAGDLSDVAAEAFAATSDHSAQDKVLKRLSKNPDAWQVRQALGTDDDKVGDMLRLVGRDAYEKAGHHVNESLFTSDDYDDEVAEDGLSVSDPGALKVMATDKLQARCAQLTKEGWGWAIVDADAPKDIHSWKRVYPTSGNKFAKAAMKAAGCVVRLVHQGKMDVQQGYVKPGETVQLPKGSTKTKEQQAKAKARDAAKAKGELPVTNTLAQRMSQQMTLAAADVLTSDPKLAMVILAAMLACDSNASNLTIRDSGTFNRVDGDEWRKRTDRYDNEFGKYLQLYGTKTPDQLATIIAMWVGEAVDVTCHTAGGLPLDKDTNNEQARDLLLFMSDGGAPISQRLVERFNAADYFKSMSADAARMCIIECDPGMVGQKKIGDGKKATLVHHAATEARRTGWLPPEMRLPSYAGPAVKKPPATSVRKPAAKAKRKARR